MSSVPIRPTIPPPNVHNRPSRLMLWLVRLPLLAFAGMMLLILVLLLFLAAFQIRYQSLFYPGVNVAGVDVSGLTPEQARPLLANAVTYGSDTVFTLRDGNRIWQMNAAELGLSFNLDATLQTGFAIGHDSDIVSNLTTQADAWFNGQIVPPVIEYDRRIAAAKLQTMADDITQQPVNATLSLTGASVSTTAGQNGRVLDVPATLTLLETAISNLESGAEIPLVINESPPTVWSVEPTANLIRNALSAPLTLVALDDDGQSLGPWTITTEQLAALLVVTLTNNADGTQSYDASIDMSAFEIYLAGLAPGLIRSPRDGRFLYNDGTGQLEIVQEAVNGRSLNIEETLARLEEAVFLTENRSVSMAFDYTLPAYHNQITAAELGIRELVAESTTYYSGSSANRRTNIAVSASRFNGVLIAPGDEFAFNTLLGDISEENGFVEGNVIFGGRTVTGLGGGVCQVSTTAFRAAFTGGFAITERNSHGYRVGYYEQRNSPPGLDAAIWQPERDFRFQNNTPYHLLIETSYVPGEDALQFRFYSTKHWQAQLEDPIINDRVPALPTTYEANGELQPGQSLQVDYSAEGADVTVYRNVYDMQGNLVLEDYEYTHYLPWGAIIQVAPGDSRLSQSS
ncbi:MAG: VanW family protein [Aggregatilineales bacterium]